MQRPVHRTALLALTIATSLAFCSTVAVGATVDVAIGDGGLVFLAFLRDDPPGDQCVGPSAREATAPPRVLLGCPTTCGILEFATRELSSTIPSRALERFRITAYRTADAAAWSARSGW